MGMWLCHWLYCTELLLAKSLSRRVGGKGAHGSAGLRTGLVLSLPLLGQKRVSCNVLKLHVLLSPDPHRQLSLPALLPMPDAG